MKKFIIKVYKAELKMVKKIINAVSKFVKRLLKNGPKVAICFAAAEAATANKVGNLLEGNNFKVVSLDAD